MRPHLLPALFALSLAACDADEAALTTADAEAKVDAAAKADAEVDLEVDAAIDVEADAAAPCRVDADCDIGPWGACRIEDGTCQHDLAGTAFRLESLAMTGAVGEILEPTLRGLVTEEKLNLLVYLESATAAGYTAWIIQGSPAGTDPSGLPAYAPSAELPTFLGEATPGEACAEGFSLCQDVETLAHENTGVEAGELALHLPRPIDGDACAYGRFSMVARIVLSLDPLTASDPRGAAAHMRLTGGIHGAAARRLTVDAAGTSLAEALEARGAAPDFELGGWRFEIAGPAQQVMLSPRSNPRVHQASVPPGCPE